MSFENYWSAKDEKINLRIVKITYKAKITDCKLISFNFISFSELQNGFLTGITLGDYISLS